MDTLLLDECLSPALIAIAATRGIDATHVTYIGMKSWSDWRIVKEAVERDYIVVTNNRTDFLREYAKLEIHLGLLIIVPNETRMVQEALFAKLLEHVTVNMDETINKVIEIDESGVIKVYDWSALLDDEPR